MYVLRTVISHLPALNVISGWIDMIVCLYEEAKEAWVDGSEPAAC